jgi:hypothetical protein
VKVGLLVLVLVLVLLLLLLLLLGGVLIGVYMRRGVNSSPKMRRGVKPGARTGTGTSTGTSGCLSSHIIIRSVAVSRVKHSDRHWFESGRVHNRSAHLIHVDDSESLERCSSVR